MYCKIDAIPINDRPREKAINNGIDSLSNLELMALVLRCGTKKLSVMELANNILSKYKDLNNLINCSYEELISIKGIKKAKAVEILAIMEIAKRVEKNKIMAIKSINHPDQIYNSFSILLKEEKQENFYVIFLNIKSHLIKYERLFVGGVSSSIIDTNLIFKKALIYGASKIICVHNHPSGDPKPSIQDLQVTKKIEKIGELVNIVLLDHLIIGKEKYISLKKEGYF